MTSQSSSESESDSKEKTARNPTSSEIFFTPEERQFRRQYRMVKSEFCLRELWKLYNKMVARYRPAEEALPDIDTDSMAYSMMDFDFMEDPTEEMRYEYMAKKHRYLLDGMAYLIHCPEKPYLLIQKSRELDSPGRRLVLPRAIRNTRPEVFATTGPPFEGTVAYTTQWVNVSNLNFEVVRARMQEHTQTEPVDLLRTDTIPLRPLQEPETDVSTCFLGEQEILPIPTPYVLATTWERRKLYCCEKYRQLVEENVEFERQLLADLASKKLIIDVRHKMKPEQLLSLDPELAEQIMKRQMEAPRLSMLGKYVKEALLHDKESRVGFWRQERGDKLVDTIDLPWDPYESRYTKLQPFKNMVFDESMEHFYLHAEILLTQTEMYSVQHMYADLGDLASTAQRLGPPPEPAEDEKPSAS